MFICVMSVCICECVGEGEYGNVCEFMGVVSMWKCV